MTFYIITPFILYFKSCIGKMCISGLLIIVIALLMNYINIDIRTFYYLPIYLCSLIIPSQLVQKIRGEWITYMLCSMVVLMITIKFLNIELITLLSSLLFVPVFLISVSTFLSKSDTVCHISAFISYASMNMYLFHRHIYMAFVFTFVLVGIERTEIFWWLISIPLPIIIVFSFYFQKIYDRFCKKLSW